MSLRKNLFYNYLRVAVQFLYPIVTFPYVSRILGADGVGEVDFAKTVIGYGILASVLGLNNYGTNAIARTAGDPERRFRVSSELFSINLVFALAATACLVPSFFAVSRFRQSIDLLLIFVPFIVLNGFGMEWYFQGTEQFKFVAVRQLVVQAAAVVLMFVFVRTEADLFRYGWVTFFSYAAPGVLNFARFVREHGRFPRLRFRWKQHREGLTVLSLVTVLTSVYLNLDIVLLGFLSDSSEVGYYAAGIKISRLMIQVIVAGCAVFLARNAGYDSNDDAQSLKRSFFLSLHSILLVGLPISAGLFSLRSEIIRLFAGEAFGPSVPVLAWTSWLVVLVGTANVIGVQYFYSTRRHRSTLLAVIVGAAVSLPLNIVLIPRYGAFGAAIAYFCTESTVTAVLVFLARERLREFICGTKLWGIAVGTAAVIAVTAALDLLADASWLPLMFAKIGAGVLVYAVCVTAFGDPLVKQILTRGPRSRG